MDNVHLSTLTDAVAANPQTGSTGQEGQGQNSAQDRPDSLSPAAYANAVKSYSDLSTGVGQNYERLARFLKPRTYCNEPTTPGDDVEFVTLYELGSSREAVAQSTRAQQCPTRRNSSSGPSRGVGEVTNYSSHDQFSRLNTIRSEDSRSQLLFMRGYPSRDWLKALGAKYQIDPEFFSRHLDFRSTAERSNNFSIPSLPSSSWHLMSLNICTIGSWGDSGKRFRQADIMRSREEHDSDMETYHHRLTVDSNVKIGDAIVRSFSTLDEMHFALEQRVSICLRNIGQSWIVLVWLDSGKDLSENSDGPWSWQSRSRKAEQIHLLPIISYRPSIALKSHLIVDALSADSRRPKRPPQNSSLLHIQYGRSLRSALKALDPFYALTEIFQFAASSEKQFLNLIDMKLDVFLGGDQESDFKSLSNLKYVNRLLCRHIQQIQQTLDSIHNTKHPKWPKARDHLGLKAASASEAIKQDFEHLLAFARALHDRCNEGISILMSTVSIEESEKAMVQAQRLGKLTFLAFIFVPLSFTTSFYGMNFKELDAKTLSIWAWFALSVPVLSITLFSFFFDIQQAWRVILRRERTRSM